MLRINFCQVYACTEMCNMLAVNFYILKRCKAVQNICSMCLCAYIRWGRDHTYIHT